jgi:hypothetical protein
VVSDLGLRLAGELLFSHGPASAHLVEGIHDLKIDQSLAPTREVLNNAFAAGSSAFATGSSSLFRAFDGARTNIAGKLKEREEAERIRKEKAAAEAPPPGQGDNLSPSRVTSPSSTTSGISGLPSPPVADIRATLGGIGSGIGSFFGSRVASFRGTGAGTGAATTTPTPVVSTVKATPERKGLRPMSLTPSASTTSTGKGRVISNPTLQE